MTRPGALCVRALNEYRPRDLVSYLVLRQYLLSTCARSDRWSQEVATDLTLTRTTVPYRHCRTYKGISEREQLIEFRDLHFPAPAEMLAEAALLNECASAGHHFSPNPCVFSNVLATGETRSGMVEPYFQVWSKRQAAILSAAQAAPTHSVLYLDIRRFYPSIPLQLARRSWHEAAEASRIGLSWRQLGERLLADYSQADRGEGALLMGPMFAHIMGNLVLRSFDSSVASIAPGPYFRYVDDMAFVVPTDAIPRLCEDVEGLLPDGLHLNRDKVLQMQAGAWAKSWLSFSHDAALRAWSRLLSAVKYFILAYPERVPELIVTARGEGYRMPFHSYAAAARQRNYVERLSARLIQPWFDATLKPRTPSQVVSLLAEARKEFQERVYLAAERTRGTTGMERKFAVQRLRYITTRLLYLAEPAVLASLADAMGEFRELSDIAVIARSAVSADVTNLLAYSGSVAQAAAQVLVAAGRPVSASTEFWSADKEFAWAVLRVAGVPFRSGSASPPPETHLAALVDGADAPIRRTQPNAAYYQDVLAVGSNLADRPEHLVSEAFDLEEVPTLDAVQVLRQSS